MQNLQSHLQWTVVLNTYEACPSRQSLQSGNPLSFHCLYPSPCGGLSADNENKNIRIAGALRIDVAGPAIFTVFFRTT